MDFGRIFGDLDADRIGDVISLVLANRDVIANLGRLPQFFDTMATSLAAAGAEAHDASVALIGRDGRTGAKGTLVSASGALGDIVETLDKGADLVAQTAKGAARVPLMDGPAGHLTEAAGELASANARLRDLAASMAAIAEVLETVGQALGKVGDHLADTGSEARGFMAMPTN